jgi:glycoside/pentoside/hexuronide:cation symporter, GPH family
MSSAERLKMRTKLGFGVGSVAEGAIYIAFNTWNFLFYNQVLGLSGTLAGLAVTISLLLDGVSEPIVGSLSDRWRSKLGRRHPFLFAAPIPLALSFYLLYTPPAGLSDISLFLWFTLFATIHRQAMTLYQIPHLALGAELSTDYKERSVVMSYATLFTVVGGAGTYFYGWTWFAKIQGGSGVREGYAGMAAGVALVSALVIFLSALLTRDQIPRLIQPSAASPRFGLRELFAEIGDCLKNRNYRMLLLGLLCMSATLGTRETVQSYASLFFWELPESKIRIFGLASPPAFILAFFLTVRFHHRYDKRNTMLGAVVLLILASALPVLLRIAGVLPANGSAQLVSVLMLFVFLFYLATAILTISVLSALADVADEHELLTGRRQEGIFYAARTFFAKLSSGLGHIVAGAAIDLIAFPTGAKPGQVAEDIVLKLGLLDGPIAAVPSLLAIVFYGAYRIDRKRHAEIQRELAERRGMNAPGAAGVAANPAVGPTEPAIVGS